MPRLFVSGPAKLPRSGGPLHCSQVASRWQAAGEVLVDEGEADVTDVQLIPHLLTEGDGAVPIRVVRVQDGYLTDW
jgi:hypothetical protein